MANRSYIISTFVTENSPYEQVAKEYLLPSAQKLGLEVEVMVMPNLHNWNYNVGQKPLAVLKLMEKFPDKDIVLLDADAKIESYPFLFDTLAEKDIDIAAHTLSWETHYNRPGAKEKELLSGTLWLRNCDKVKELCNAWHFEYTRTSQWEQICLFSVLKKGDYKIFQLPLSYAYITSMPTGEEPFVKIENPVITHWQVSRTLKRMPL